MQISDMKLMQTSNSRSYLRCQVESEEAVVTQRILDQKRDLVAKAKLHRLAQAASLAEVGEVLKRKCQGNRLREVDLHVVLLLFNVGVGA